MKNFRRSKKALSPVVASIILIAVTVAVSIAVAAWMGALTVGFMQTEQLTITSVTFNGVSGAGTTVTMIANNTGTASVTINQVWVGTAQATFTSVPTSATAAANSGMTLTVTLPAAWASGNNYAFKLISTKGNNYLYTAIAP